MEGLIIMPWSSDSEWQSVRQDIYGGTNLRNYKQALRKLLLWKTRGKSLSRGLYCTELILQVITKDIYFCKVDDIINENDLIRLYSMAIMKFVNLTADILGKGPQKSMYFRASRLELPSWLIDMRHKISHDQELPNLISLRTAMEFLLQWLQTKYWNEDENFSVTTPKLNTIIVDDFINILELYLLNKIQINTAVREEHLNILKDKLFMFEYSNKECIKKIKEFLVNKVWSLQLINVFVSKYLLHARECSNSKGRISKTDKVIWSLLLKIFTNYGLLTDILQCLVIQNSRTAALWVIELCMVVYQNNKKIKINRNDNCMNCKSLNLDTSLVLRTSLNSPHRYTILFLKWLLRIQFNPMKTKQQYNIIKLVSLYTGSVKFNSKNLENIFTVDDLLDKSKNQHQSQWTMTIGQMNWKQIPFGTIL